MASIEIPCANPDCDSENVDLINSTEIEDRVIHQFVCNDCRTHFEISTKLQNVKIPKPI